MRKALQFFAVIVLVAACGSGDEVAVEEVAPATAPVPTPEDRNEANSELEPVEVELKALLSADGDTVTVAGTTNLPDGAVLVWELAETVEAFGLNPDVTLRDADGEVPAGNVTVLGGSYRLELSETFWAELDLCVALPLELFVAYMPLADVAALGALPEQPSELYELYGENGERIPGAVAPAELRVRSRGERSVELLVQCR